MMRCLQCAGLLLVWALLPACGAPAPNAPKVPSVVATPVVNEVAKPAPASWPTYHGGTSLDGVADVALPDSLALAWRFESGSRVVNTPVVGNERVCFADEKGIIHALDLQGKEVWSKAFTKTNPDGRPPSKLYFDAPLAIFDGVLIAGESNGTVYALNVADGSLRWECKTEAVLLGSPNIADVSVDGKTEKRLYFIDQTAGGLQSIDFNTGKLLWSVDGRDRCDGSPSVNASFAVYGSCASALHIFSPINGEMLREVSLEQDSQVAGGVVLLGDSMYSGSRSGHFIHADARTGKIFWTNSDCTGEAFNTPAVGAERIVFGANDGYLFALSRKDGVLVWKHKMDDTPSSPVIARDKVVVTASGALHLLRLSDGQKIWSFPVSDEITSPAIAGSLVIVGADDGTVTAFGSKAGE